MSDLEVYYSHQANVAGCSEDERDTTGDSDFDVDDEEDEEKKAAFSDDDND